MHLSNHGKWILKMLEKLVSSNVYECFVEKSKLKVVGFDCIILESIKELSFCYKLKFSSPYIFVT